MKEMENLQPAINDIVERICNKTATVQEIELMQSVEPVLDTIITLLTQIVDVSGMGCGGVVYIPCP